MFREVQREVQTKYLVFTASGRDKQWKEEFMGYTLTHCLTQMHTHTNTQP